MANLTALNVDDEATARSHLAAIVASSDDAIISKDLEGRILTWNRGAELLYGYSAAEVVGERIHVIVPAHLHGEVDGFLTAVARGERVEHHDTQRVRKDGGTVEVSLTISPVRDTGGRIVAASVIARDITQRKQLERAAGHLAAIIESSDDAIVSKDLRGRILSWNRGAERLYGYAPEEAIGRPIQLVVPDDLHPEIELFLTAVGRGERVEHHDTRRVRKDGSTVEVSLTISPVRDSDGCIIAASVIARDITERKHLERRLLKIAGEDQLTGLANRRAFLRHLERHIDACARTGWTGALIAIDIDRFKAINDTLGHGAGDHVIKQTAARLRKRLRSTDLLARLGGDEFVVLLPSADAPAAETVTADIVRELALQEITIGGARCATGSVGWALIDEAMTADEALIRADLAAYAAKRGGGNQAQAYSAETDARFDGTLTLDPALLLDDL